MHNLIRKFVDRLPLQFRALYHQFLLRIVDLEALSIEADIPRFLGQFAGVLMMFSMINALGLLIHPPIDNIAYLVGMFWTVEQRMIFTMMLVVGLFAVISWDSIFPGRCDVMVLGPGPRRDALGGGRCHSPRTPSSLPGWLLPALSWDSPYLP